MIIRLSLFYSFSSLNDIKWILYFMKPRVNLTSLSDINGFISLTSEWVHIHIISFEIQAEKALS